MPHFWTDLLTVALFNRRLYIAKIQAAKAALEEMKRQEVTQRGRESDDEVEGPPTADTGGKSDTALVPRAEDQINFTDPEGRIMKDNATKSFAQAYNAQLAVDCAMQIIVSADVTQQANDKNQLVPLMEQIEANTGRIPDRILADSGYFSAENVESCTKNYIEPFICRDRIKHSDTLPAAPKGRIPKPLSCVERMCRKLLTKEGRKTYSKRKESVEAVIGQIKQVRGFRQFLLRGLEKVRAEWRLICLGHNVLKMWRSGRSLPASAEERIPPGNVSAFSSLVPLFPSSKGNLTQESSVYDEQTMKTLPPNWLPRERLSDGLLEGGHGKNFVRYDFFFLDK